MPLSSVTVCSISGTTDNHYTLFWKYSWRSRMSLQVIGSMVSNVTYLVIWVTKLTYAYRRGDNIGLCFFFASLTHKKQAIPFLILLLFLLTHRDCGMKWGQSPCLQWPIYWKRNAVCHDIIHKLLIYQETKELKAGSSLSHEY